MYWAIRNRKGGGFSESGADQSTTLAVSDLAGAHSVSSLGTHCSAVSGALVGHDTRTSGLDRAGLGHGSGFRLHFSAGAVGFELGGELRSIGFVSVGAKEAKAATAAMERKRAVLFMMDKSLKLKKRLKKAGSKNHS